MPLDPALQFRWGEAARELLACPACFGSLRLDGAHLKCAACRRAYPIVDGIPVLIAERAETSEPAPE
jgi:uncharacterized protein YbaR (Trm112 family)